MTTRWSSVLVGTICAAALLFPHPCKGTELRKCSIPGAQSSCNNQSRPSTPTCSIEMTCTDKPIQLGYSDGVCFRASCPGIWALMHKRADQASFRHRYFTYRHYAYTGRWELKDQGVIESGLTEFRELFLVLPDDLIELKLRDPDMNAAIEVRNLGYLKKGNVEELKKWLAYNIYLERPEFRTAESESNNNRGVYQGAPGGFTDMILSPINCVGRLLGLPWF